MRIPLEIITGKYSRSFFLGFLFWRLQQEFLSGIPIGVHFRDFYRNSFYGLLQKLWSFRRLILKFQRTIGKISRRTSRNLYRAEILNKILISKSEGKRQTDLLEQSPERTLSRISLDILPKMLTGNPSGKIEKVLRSSKIFFFKNYFGNICSQYYRSFYEHSF